MSTEAGQMDYQYPSKQVFPPPNQDPSAIQWQPRQNPIPPKAASRDIENQVATVYTSIMHSVCNLHTCIVRNQSISHKLFCFIQADSTSKNHYLPLSVFTVIFCCFPLSVFALISSVKVCRLSMQQ